ncbi:protein angel homolog 2-like [Schistocerca gregaria]|uniref:protein angel homolog 2-like n=1 Tax=Schistocerca gregaria TaxID=7010 RepID=UPI00211E2ADD|nr:protein angel homolog 2-like [Schistocerca gregaria]
MCIPTAVPTNVQSVLSRIKMIEHPTSGEESKLGLYNFKVATWNVLADGYTFPNYYSHCTAALNWSTRFPLIIQHIGRADPDILCLQEADHWDEYKRALNLMGYKTLYLKRSGCRRDGCAICVKRKKIKIVERKCIYFNSLCELPFEDASRIQRDSVALVAVLQPIVRRRQLNDDGSERLNEEAAAHQPTKFCVATTHIFWDPQYEDVKCRQVHYLMVKLEQFWKKAKNLILCGDFNSPPTSAIIEFLRKGKVDLRTWDLDMIPGNRQLKPCHGWSSLGLIQPAFEKQPKQASNSGNHRRYSSLFLRLKSPILRHKFQFQSVYQCYRKHMEWLSKGRTLSTDCEKKVFTQRYKGKIYEPLITSHFSQFSGTLDYIFVANGVRPVRYLQLPSEVELMKIGPLPTDTFASDHLMLMCEIHLEN